MKQLTLKYMGVGLLALAVVSGCGKKGDDDDSPAAPAAGTTGVTPASGDTVAVTGQLVLNAQGLAAEQRQVLLFTMLAGKIFSAPAKVDVDADGRFSVNVDAQNGKLAAVKTAMAQSPIDKAPLKSAFPEYANDIDGMSDEQLKTNLQNMITQMEAQGGPQYLLISYAVSGDPLAEAKSFQFIGLPTGGKNVMVLPGDALKGNLGLGSITGSGDDATTELKADDSVFALDNNALTQLASLGQTLKMVKNFWVNKTADGTKTNLEAQPFFAWQGKIADIGASGSAPAALKYTGYGMYVKFNSQEVNFETMCPSSGTPSQSVQLYPPADIKWQTMNYDGTLSAGKTFGTAAPLNNGQTSRQDQNGKSVCNGSESGFYARDDGNGDYMLNWGTGGSLQGKVPAGFWDFKLASASKGQFDLSAGYPVDDSGNAKVLVPQLTLTKSGDNVTHMSVKFAVFNTVTNTYEQATDLSLFKKMATDIAMSVSISNGNGADEHRGQAEGSDGDAKDIVLTWDGATLNGAIGAAYQKPIAADYSASGQVVSFAISYVIGGSSYRFEFRP
jgi:hypothetical protein